ncbi:hypothetical protein [Agarilytica rhodophyticola]|uniref:hypothetical protein n=1 Tax=Agarilytica rhodophyticola TaxID=1737490 RepID=UPI000B341535|nr:hypothetical protein [Agarilytica rhodophyticola]
MSNVVKEWRPKLTKGAASNKLAAYQELLADHADDDQLMELVSTKLIAEQAERLVEDVLKLEVINNIDVSPIVMSRAEFGKKPKIRQHALRQTKFFPKNALPALKRIFLNDEDLNVRESAFYAIADHYFESNDEEVLSLLTQAHPSIDAELNISSDRFYRSLSSLNFSKAYEVFIRSRLDQKDFENDKYLFSAVHRKCDEFEHMLPDFKRWLEEAVPAEPEPQKVHPEFEDAVEHYMLKNHGYGGFNPTPLSTIIKQFLQAFNDRRDIILFCQKIAETSRDKGAIANLILSVKFRSDFSRQEVFDFIWQYYADAELDWYSRLNALSALLSLPENTSVNESLYQKIIATAKQNSSWFTFITLSYIKAHADKIKSKNASPSSNNNKIIKVNEQELQDLLSALVLHASDSEKNSLYYGALSRMRVHNWNANDYLPTLFWVLSVALPGRRRLAFSTYWDQSASLSESVEQSMGYYNIPQTEFSEFEQLRHAQYESASLVAYADFLSNKQLRLIEVDFNDKECHAIVVDDKGFHALQSTIQTLGLSVTLKDVATNTSVDLSAPKFSDELRSHQIEFAIVQKIFELMAFNVTADQRLKICSELEHEHIQNDKDKRSAIYSIVEKIDAISKSDSAVLLSSDWKDNSSIEHQVNASMNYLGLPLCVCTLSDKDYQQENYKQWQAYGSFLNTQNLTLIEINDGSDTMTYIVVKEQDTAELMQLVGGNIDDSLLIIQG